ncbi:MAG: FtsQ-type POTRA domain-containing protein [Actinobacteria bacterium]|nr:MAG: FtsQ-type POTRA domain-containing protein [Actinomycetota bacterium]
MAVVPFPQRRRLGAPDLARVARLVPTGRALLVAGAALGAAGVLYLVARETPLFAVRSIEVSGVHGAAAAHVRAALRSLEGKSLLALHGSDVEGRLASVPDVQSATYDRAFPNTLRIVVVPERPVAVIRQGASAWLVSARGRVLAAAGLAASKRRRPDRRHRVARRGRAGGSGACDRATRRVPRTRTRRFHDRRVARLRTALRAPASPRRRAEPRAQARRRRADLPARPRGGLPRRESSGAAGRRLRERSTRR